MNPGHVPDSIDTALMALQCLLIGGATVFGCALMACLVLRCWVRREFK